ncbi:unnamed protein product [Rotaria sordida]|uniref:Uncharacterized protein n=1 Tax=Rotaria sordida TaxID=392033 RepID=A0A814JSH8_9BILA|nr:unnamed protein product [Rotaria sordida]CAF1305149.1 unnamed protein product [Rotaria sordida]
MKALISYSKQMADSCTSTYNISSVGANDSYCPALFDRIACWPPTEPGVRRYISCPSNVFPNSSSDGIDIFIIEYVNSNKNFLIAYATRLCTNQSRWEDKSHYGLCIGCSPDELSNSSRTNTFSLPEAYIVTRRYFIVCANGLSIILLACGILILLGNSRLRQCSRNILHVNVFLVFLIRSAIQLIAELRMSRGYFAHNVFDRTDACNRTTTYFKEDQLLDCKLFTILMNYINSSVSHWFVFCEAFYLFRLLRAKAYKDRVRWYILTGWLAPLILTILTYTTRYMKKTDLHTCWFEPSTYDWILHGPNVILQIFNFIIFIYICVLLARKLNKTYRTAAFSDRRRFAKYSRLTRSTLILLPVFGIHYFLFMWNTKPFLISNLILIHLTVHTVASSLQGLIVALIYTLINAEVQREMFRSFDRCLTRNNTRWQQPYLFRNYMNKLDNDRLYSLGYPVRSTPVQYRQKSQLTGVIQYHRCTNQHKFSLSNPSQQNSINTATAIAKELSLLNSTATRRQSLVNIQNNPVYFT